MRLTLIAVLLSLTIAKSQVNTSTQETQIEVSYSKPLGTFRFLESLSGHDPHMNEQIFNYLFSDEDTVLNNTVALFNSINVDYTFIWEDYPNTRKKYRSTYDLLITALATSKTTQELPQKLIGIIPHKDLNFLLLCLNRITPYYNQYIGEKYIQNAAQEVAKYQEYTPTLTKHLQDIQHFYGAIWPRSLPIVVSLLPTPGKIGFTNTSPHGNVLVCNFLTDNPSDYKNRIGIIMREACHLFYDAQSIDVQTQIEDWFHKHPSLYKGVAYKYFDEGLATALGHGWMYPNINQTKKEGVWHDNPFVDVYGKALLPIVERYLNEHQVMDSLFVNEAILLFQQKFPSSIYEYQPLINTMTIFSNTDHEQKIKELSKAIKRHFQVYSYEFITPLKTKESTEAISKKKGTQLFIIDGRYRSNMNYLKSVLPELSLKLERTRVPFKRNQYYSYINDQNEAVIITLISDTPSFDAILEAMKQETYINPDVVFHDLNK